jgi:hypothetical protein
MKMYNKNYDDFDNTGRKYYEIVVVIIICLPEVIRDHKISMFHSNREILFLLGIVMAVTALLSCKYFTNYFQVCLHIYFAIYLYVCKPL